MESYKGGRLFYLDGSHGIDGQSANGKGSPDFAEGVSIIADGPNGLPAFSCKGDALRYAYCADKNVYATRGTVSFFVRPVMPVGPTAFPIFRISYADHSSWDAVFLRIDYNGSGFDAFVTNQNLERVRISYAKKGEWRADEWLHIAFSWDACIGVKLYINGEQVSVKPHASLLDAQLDRFGFFSRIIAPWNVQSMFNYIRGGDFADLSIYDHMLADEQIVDLFNHKQIEAEDEPRDWRKLPNAFEWLQKNGWNNSDELPPELEGSVTAADKVEIHDAYDVKRWWWKSCDGIRETTWPGVINRSSLKGRYDYFLLPDWDCYTLSGKQIDYHIPSEQWNHIECYGGAYGTFSWINDGTEKQLCTRSKGMEKTSVRFPVHYRGGIIRFVNQQQERPISEFSLYNVYSVNEMPRDTYEPFTFDKKAAENCAYAEDAFTTETLEYIKARYIAQEQRVLVPNQQMACTHKAAFPCAHYIIPSAMLNSQGLDRISVTFPKKLPLPVVSGSVPINVQIHDPNWSARLMADFSFCLTEGGQTVVLGLRKRVLHRENGLFVSIYGASEEMDDSYFSGVEIRVYGIPAQEALHQHIEDRFTQVRDLYAHMVEERAGDPRYRTFQRFCKDIFDLQRVAPNHYLAQCYLYDSLSTCNAQLSNIERPHFCQKPLIDGVPGWAQRQCEYLEYAKRFYEYWIDKRQIENGEFGGGLSDDGDLTSWWPGIALCGLMTDELLLSLQNEWRAFDAQGMLTNGMSTIQTDEMHVFEEGITCLGQNMLLDYGNPSILEKGMLSARAIFDLAQINKKGHMHFITSYFSGTVKATEDPWGQTTSNSYLVCHPMFLLAWYNRNKKCAKMIIDLADGLLAHYREGQMYATIHFKTDNDSLPTTPHWRWLLMAAYKLTNDESYLAPIADTVSYRKNGVCDKDERMRCYEKLIWDAAIREYINTEGQLWVDRVVLDIEQLQTDRLGGVAHQRFEIATRNFLSWHFPKQVQTKVALLTPVACESFIRIIAWNMTEKKVHAEMGVWNITSGKWTMRAAQTENDALSDTEGEVSHYCLGHGDKIPVTILPGVQYIIELSLDEAYEDKRFRADLGISSSDVRREIGCLRVTVHSIGYLDAPESTIALYDASGTLKATCTVPPLPAPSDLRSSTADAILPIPGEADLSGWSVLLDPDGKLKQITRQNDRVVL